MEIMESCLFKKYIIQNKNIYIFLRKNIFLLYFNFNNVILLKCAFIKLFLCKNNHNIYFLMYILFYY